MPTTSRYLPTPAESLQLAHNTQTTDPTASAVEVDILKLPPLATLRPQLDALRRTLATSGVKATLQRRRHVRTPYLLLSWTPGTLAGEKN
ncbi:hypothetical protein D3C81_1814850 [compost metagenome]